MSLLSLENRYGDDKVYDACGLFGIMDVTGALFSGRDIITGITNMEERGNGLGAGFAVYGCYPDHADCYAFHVMFTDPQARPQVEVFLKENFVLVRREEVPHQTTTELPDPPLIWRYFLHVDPKQIPEDKNGDEEEYVVDRIMTLNTSDVNAYIYASGKDTFIHPSGSHPIRATHDANCTACGKCVEACPLNVRAIDGVTDPARCIGCGVCTAVCPQGAWKMSDVTLPPALKPPPQWWSYLFGLFHLGYLNWLMLAYTLFPQNRRTTSTRN
jgi:ferredoxin